MNKNFLHEILIRGIAPLITLAALAVLSYLGMNIKIDTSNPFSQYNNDDRRAFSDIKAIAQKNSIIDYPSKNTEPTDSSKKQKTLKKNAKKMQKNTIEQLLDTIW